MSTRRLLRTLGDAEDLLDGGRAGRDLQEAVFAQASHAHEEVLVAELDFDLIPKERKQEPVLKNLRPELYNLLTVSEKKSPPC